MSERGRTDGVSEGGTERERENFSVLKSERKRVLES